MAWNNSYEYLIRPTINSRGVDETLAFSYMKVSIQVGASMKYIHANGINQIFPSNKSKFLKSHPSKSKQQLTRDNWHEETKEPPFISTPGFTPERQT